MPRLLLLLTICSCSLTLCAQATLSGWVRDANSQRAIANVEVALLNTQVDCRTDAEGYFKLQVLRSGRYRVLVSRRGYEAQEVDIQIHPGCAALTLSLEPTLLGRDSWETWTPDRNTGLDLLPDSLVEQQLGNQDFAEVFRQLPGAYVSRQGGGWGDSRLALHGFGQQEVAFTLNGIPLNDPENAQFYWSRWSVLRHLGPTLDYLPAGGQSWLATGAMGGELRMLSRGVEVSPERSFTLQHGNDNFQSYRLNWQHGLGRGQWGLTAMLAHDRGNGYVDGTEFQAFSYFLSLEKKLNAKHRITLTALGSSQWHHQRSLAGNLDQITLRTFVDPDQPGSTTNLGRRFNHDWGYRNGAPYSARRNFYSQPLYALNHLWQPKPKLRIVTMAYGYHGRGGDTGLRGRIRDGRNSFGDAFTGFGTGIYDTLGQIRFDDMVAYNQGAAVAGFGDPKAPTAEGQYIVSRNGLIDSSPAGSGFVRRASINNTDHYGLASQLRYRMSRGLQVSIGIDYRQFRSQHFRRLEDLLGADGYLSRGNLNEPDKLITAATPARFGQFDTDPRATTNNVLNYNYSGQIRTLGLLGRLSYERGSWRFYGQMNRGNQQLQRTDYFNYAPEDNPDNDLNEDGEYHQSPVQTHDYHSYLLGFTYQLGGGQGLSGQYGMTARAPLFDEIFEGNRNRIKPEPGAQQGRNWQLQYALQRESWAVQLRVYQQAWSGQVAQRNLSNYTYAYAGDSLQVSALARFAELQQLHEGINLAFTYGLGRALQLRARLGLGNWRFPEDQTGLVTDLENDRPAGKLTLATADLPIGNAAQTTLALGMQWEIRPGLRLLADYFYFDRLSAPWSIAAGLPDEVVQLPPYGLLDLQLRYHFVLGRRTTTSLFFRLNNALDETYVAELSSSIADDARTLNRNEFYDNRGIFGLGRTWNAGMQISF